MKSTKKGVVARGLLVCVAVFFAALNCYSGELRVSPSDAGKKFEAINTVYYLYQSNSNPVPVVVGNIDAAKATSSKSEIDPSQEKCKQEQLDQMVAALNSFEHEDIESFFVNNSGIINIIIEAGFLDQLNSIVLNFKSEQTGQEKIKISNSSLYLNYSYTREWQNFQYKDKCKTSSAQEIRGFLLLFPITASHTP